MGPKIPLMKFKPKTDTRPVKEEVPDETLSTFQVERLRQVEAAAAAQTSANATASTAQPQQQGGGASAVKAEGGRSGAPGGGSSVATTTASASAAGGGGAGGRGRREQAIVGYISKAETKLEALPENSIHDAMEGDEDGSFKPITLRGSKSGARSTSASTRRIGSDQPQSSLRGEVPADVEAPEEVNKGVAFLHQHEIQTEQTHRSNLNFFGDKSNEGLIWLQLPTAVPSAKSQFSLHATPPGKIGQLIVYKSGRTVLRVNGVDHLVQCEDESTKGAGIAQNAVALLPSPDGGMSNPCCYELGPVSKKVICTPLVDLR